MAEPITTEIATGQAPGRPGRVFNRNESLLGHHRPAMAARSLDPDEQESVRNLARGLIHKLGSQTALANALGFKPQHISAMTRKEQPTNPGVPFARALAEYAGISLDEALGHVGKQKAVVRDDPYPNLTRATKKFLDAGGLVAAAELVREELAKGQHDREELDWWEALLKANDNVKFTQRHPSYAARQDAAAKELADKRHAASVADETPRQRSARILREKKAREEEGEK